jgi:RimJ/RimL family protein N-acetyltransferase
VLETDRLILRSWCDDDVEPMAALCADPQVMAHFPRLQTREETAALIQRLREHEEREGFTFWAVEVKGGPRLIGMTGLARVTFDVPFAPTVETGWRYARSAWGHGYAVEAARAALAFGFGTLALPEIVAFLVPQNVRSAAVCERLGMRRDVEGDFLHPRFAPGAQSLAGNPQALHRLYRMARTDWQSAPDRHADKHRSVES